MGSSKKRSAAAWWAARLADTRAVNTKAARQRRIRMGDDTVMDG
jgi:hypothetical protein